MLEAQGIDEFVNIKDEYTHELKIDVKEGYEDSNQLFYSILKNLFAKGLAKSKNKNFDDQRDRVLVWKTLKEYYDQDGDKDSFGAQLLEQILRLKIMYNLHGGSDKYMGNFEQYCSQM